MKKILLGFVGILMLALPASASSILQFTEVQPFNTPFVFTSNGSQTTITASKNVQVTFDPAFCLTIGCGGAGDGVYALGLTAMSTGPAQTFGNAVFEPFSGTLSITDGAIDLLTVSFTDLLQGSLGGGNPTLQASRPPDLFSGMSTVLDPGKLGVPRGFSLSFSNYSGGLGLDGTTIRGGLADGTGTFNATTIPEPATMVLMGTGLLGLVRFARKRR